MPSVVIPAGLNTSLYNRLNGSMFFFASITNECMLLIVCSNLVCFALSGVISVMTCGNCVLSCQIKLLTWSRSPCCAYVSIFLTTARKSSGKLSFFSGISNICPKRA